MHIKITRTKHIGTTANYEAWHLTKMIMNI